MLTMESERVGEAGQRGDYPRLGDVRQMIAPDIPALVERLRFAARYFSLVANAEALLSAAAALEHQQATIERLVAETCVDPTLNVPENRKTWAKKMTDLDMVIAAAEEFAERILDRAEGLPTTAGHVTAKRDAAMFRGFADVLKRVQARETPR